MSINPEISNTTQDNEINIKEVLLILLQGKKLLSIFLFLGFSLATIYALYLPDIYKSEAILAPVEPQSGISKTANAFDSLAGLAGIEFDAPKVGDKTSEAVEKLSSLSFFTNSILPFIELQDLLAVDSYNYSSNIITYDKKKFDPLENKWVRNVNFPRKQVPTPQEAYKTFAQILSIDEDEDTGFVKIGIEHQSPFIAEKWTSLVFRGINKTFSDIDKLEAEKSIEYLNKQISDTNFAEIKVALSELIQREIQKLTLIESTDDYVFQYIDPPVIEENKNRPRRTMICIIGSILGFVIGCIILIFPMLKERLSL
tara:strand:+ start:2515 stop:3453 length:939 start_codon:yes stop_codon:yes gene_type:complete